MKGLKKLSLITTLFISVLALNYCKGPEGDPGPKGDQGAQGTQGLKGDSGAKGATGATGAAGTNGTNGANGTNGNANVKQFTFGSYTVTGTSGFLSLVIPVPTSIMGSSMYLVYVHQSFHWYSLPGYGIGGDSEWRIYYDAIDDSETTVTIQRVTGTADEVFDGVRILVVPSTSNQNLSRIESEVDFKNYEAVKRYYQLPE